MFNRQIIFTLLLGFLPLNLSAQVLCSSLPKLEEIAALFTGNARHQKEIEIFGQYLLDLLDSKVVKIGLAEKKITAGGYLDKFAKSLSRKQTNFKAALDQDDAAKVKRITDALNLEKDVLFLSVNTRYSRVSELHEEVLAHPSYKSPVAKEIDDAADEGDGEDVVQLDGLNFDERVQAIAWAEMQGQRVNLSAIPSDVEGRSMADFNTSASAAVNEQVNAAKAALEKHQAKMNSQTFKKEDFAKLDKELNELWEKLEDHLDMLDVIEDAKLNNDIFIYADNGNYAVVPRHLHKNFGERFIRYYDQSAVFNRERAVNTLTTGQFRGYSHRIETEEELAALGITKDSHNFFFTAPEHMSQREIYEFLASKGILSPNEKFDAQDFTREFTDRGTYLPGVKMQTFKYSKNVNGDGEATNYIILVAKCMVESCTDRNGLLYSKGDVVKVQLSISDDGMIFTKPRT